MRRFLFFVFLALGVAGAATASADIKPASFDFPPDDSDLQQVISAAAAYQAAAVCDMECPKTDCAAAQAALQALSDMQSYLNELVTALGAANADALAHFQSLAKNSITNADQQAKTIWALGVHEALHNFGSALLSIASVASFAKDFATNPKAFEDLSPVEMLDRLNSWASALRSLESGINTLAKAQGAATSTPITGKFDIAGGVDTKSINDQISTINDIKKTINAAIKNGKDWRSALSKSGGAAALGQLAGRFLKLYSEDLLKERKAAMEELLRDAAAGDLVQANSYRTLQRIQARRFLAEDALLAVNNAFDAYAACVAKVCGASSISRPAIPNFTANVQGAGKKYSWGQALRWLNGAIQATLPRLTPVGFRNDCMRTAEQQPFEFILGWGSTTWCQYDPWAPMTPIPGGGPSTTDGGPKTVDGGSGPQQADGGGSTRTPTPTSRDRRPRDHLRPAPRRARPRRAARKPRTAAARPRRPRASSTRTTTTTRTTRRTRRPCR